MENSKKIKWSALDYRETEKDKDWFLALGIIFVAISIASAVYRNYFFAFFIILSGALMYFLINKKPEMIFYELNEYGLKINNHFFPYKNIKSFFIKDNNKKNNKKLLLIKSLRLFMPIISIPIEGVSDNEISLFLKDKKVLEEELEQHFAEKLVEYFEF